MSVHFDRLSNGLRVATEPMDGLESAAIGIWVTAGGRHERAEQNGIAHFLEHMAFKGTRRRSALEIAEVIEDVGGYLNAYTSREVTAYYARVLKEDVALAFDVLSDILLEPLFDQREIELERGVILQEIGQALDTPDDVVFDWLQEAAFPDQPLGRTILGPAERVKGFGREDLTGFVAEHYGPERLIVAAAGAVDHDQVMRLADAAFGALAPGRAPALVPARFAGGERREQKALEQVHFALGLEAPGYRSQDLYTAQIYASVMGGGMSSRLFQEAREKRGLCYSIFAQASAFEETGLITVYAGTSAGQAGELAGVVADELARAGEAIGEAEVARARAQMKSGLLMGLESASNRAERLARQVAIWGRVVPLAETVEQIEAVSRARLCAFAGKLAGEARAALALYGPGNGAPGLEALRARLRGGRGA